MKQTFRTMVMACAMGVAASGLLADPAFALRSPKPVATDSRLQHVVYSPNEVYKFIGHYGYQSLIEFEDDEEVVTISMGDSISWLVTPANNRIFLKPIEPDALTNMTVITSKRTYHFELHARETEQIDDPDMVFVMRFVYGRGAGISVSNFIDSVPDPTIEPEKYNFDYALTGSEEISPIRIFDDGEFTYFEFRDKNAEIPAFFLVHADGSESLINFRTRDDFIVVERVAAQFTLRHGEDVVCVFNNHATLRTTGPYPRSLDKKGNKDRGRLEQGAPRAPQSAVPASAPKARSGSPIKR